MVLWGAGNVCGKGMMKPFERLERSVIPWAQKAESEGKRAMRICSSGLGNWLLGTRVCMGQRSLSIEVAEVSSGGVQTCP